MRRDKFLKPFLQIVHVSDFHIEAVDFRHQFGWLKKRRLQDWIEQLHEWQAGTSPHDTTAPVKFKRFLKTVTVDDSQWASLETWIVDTGDRTTFGDDPSLKLGMDILAGFQGVCPTAKLLALHGNHDAWPNTQPLFASDTEIRKHRYDLRRHWYREKWPMSPLRVAIPNTEAEVQLYGFNSVIHHKWDNFWARGEINEDRYWERARQARALQQIKELSQMVVDLKSKSDMRNLRILATHHPIHYPPKWKKIHSMYLKNAKTVAEALSSYAPKGAGPLAHLVLSGHVHRLYPELGQLPRSVRQCKHRSLSKDQCQLIVGSLMQIPGGSPTEPPWSQQGEILRFYSDRDAPNQVTLERLLVGRAGAGSFDIVKPKKGRSNLGEMMVLNF